MTFAVYMRRDRKQTMKNIMIAVAALAVGTSACNAAELVPGATIHGFTVKSVTDLPEVIRSPRT